MILQFLIKPAINLGMILIPDPWVSIFFAFTLMRSSKLSSAVGRRGVLLLVF